jgi:DNA uptake protein ComE-like DNA-binding protein
VEQSLRYHAVKANSYARTPSIPDRLLASSDPYQSYLLQNVLPGDPGSPAKNAGVLLSTEAVVASLFWRWTTDDALQHRYRDAGFYEAFGAEPGSVTPFENVYLKLFDVLYRAKPHNTAALIDAYRNTFPDDAADVSRIVRATLVGQDVPRTPALWLANDGFQVGTTIYDQYRGAPHLHTFDLNAATLVDLVSVAGVDRALAAKILAAAPYQRLADLGGVAGVSPALVARFDAMSKRMQRLDTESNEEMSLTAMLRPAAERAGLALLLAGLAAAWLYRTVTGTRVARAAINGFAISLVSLVVSWSNAAPLVVGSAVFPWLLFGLPAAALSFFLRRRRRRAGTSAPKASPSPWRVLVAWGLAALPAVLLVVSVF